MPLALCPDDVTLIPYFKIGHIQGNPLAIGIIKVAAVLGLHADRPLPVGSFLGVPAFLEAHHMGLHPRPVRHAPCKEHVEPPFNHMQFRGPKARLKQIRIRIPIQQ